MTGIQENVENVVEKIKDKVEKYIVVCEDFPQLPFHILSKFKESKAQIQKDNNVVFWDKNGKITYIGKQENIEYTKSSI